MAISECFGEVGSQGRELIEHGSKGFPIACYEDDLGAKAVPWHWHEELEAAVVTEGTAIFAVGTEKYRLTAGEGIFVNAGALHGVWAEGVGVCKAHSVVFHPRLVGGSLGSVYWENYLNPLLADGTVTGLILKKEELWQKHAMEHMEQAWQACALEVAGHEFVIREELSKMIYLICSNRAASEKVIYSAKSLRDGERIKIMLHFIQSHISEEIAIAEVAQSAAISVSECLRCFQATIGMAPMQYLKQIRMELACELLAATEEKVADVAARCGYTDVSYFSKRFRLEVGCTPSEYRLRAD